MSQNIDTDFMRVALRLAYRNIGLVAPNPAVGCVIVKDGKIVGRGYTQIGGRPHAETEAIKMAGENTKDATTYVTLEPCCHHGKTPPCTDAIIEAGIKKVVIATKDPDSRVAGKGAAALIEAGIETEIGICKEEADKLNRGFILKVTENRPMVTVKIAVSADGMVTKEGEKFVISGERAMRYAHLLRKQNDAIIVGVDTVIIDDPELTCRLPGLEEFSPAPYIMDSNSRTPADCKLLKRNAKIFKTKNKEGRIDIRSALNELAEVGHTRVLIEAGSILANSFLDSEFVDRLIVAQSKNVVIGEKGKKAFPKKDEPYGLNLIEEKDLGEDIIKIYERKE